MKDYQALEKILELSKETDIKYSILFYEYLNNRCIKLKPYTAFQLIEMKYKNKIILEKSGRLYK